MANVYENANLDARNTDDASERFSRGAACLDRGDFDSAFANYNEAARLNEIDEAIAEHTETLAFSPYDSVAFISRGMAYFMKGDYDSAIADYTEAIRLDPGDSLAYFNRGFAHSENGDPDSAVADFTEAIRLDPNDAAAYSLRGMAVTRKAIALSVTECHNNASAFFSNNRGLDPDSTEPFDDIVYYLDEHDIESAIDDYATDCLGDFFDDAYHANKRDIESAMADYTEAIRLDPDHAVAYYYRGTQHARNGDAELSEADFAELKRIRDEEITEQ